MPTSTFDAACPIRPHCELLAYVFEQALPGLFQATQAAMVLGHEPLPEVCGAEVESYLRLSLAM